MPRPPLIYLDHNAAAPLAPGVREAMEPWLGPLTGNPGSVHQTGRAARAAIDQARRRIEALCNGEYAAILTAGGSSAANLAIKGVWLAARAQGRNRILVSAGEHECVLESARFLTEFGAAVELVPLTRAGQPSLEAAAAMMDNRTALLAAMAVNNETGVLSPIPELARIAHQHGALLACDAAAAAGKTPLMPWLDGADVLFAASHKLGGPVGAGVVFARNRGVLQAWEHGGPQERGLRAGTENVAAIVGMGAAAETALTHLDEHQSRVSRLRERMDAFARAIPGVRIAGESAPRICNTTQWLVEGCSSEAMLQALDLEGVAASSGSACSAGSLEPSHVLLAMGYSPEEARTALRLSIGPSTTEEEITRALDILGQVIERIRRVNAEREGS
ncbi:MAG: Cysteine desulfurase IscS [Myxococcota bacterium]|nr:Cysteine desulfurase IscS [Myxococcota bacterium]